MSPMYLYPAITNKIGGGGVGTGDVWVFRNGERLEMPVDPNTQRNPFFDQFSRPCYRIPAMVITDSGRIIVGSDYRSQPMDQVAILPCVAISDDNGKTWKKKLVDHERSPGNHVWPTSGTWLNGNYRVMDQTMFYYKGVVHIICGLWDGTANNGNWTQYQNDATWLPLHLWSEDEGETWKSDFEFKNKVSGFTTGHSWLGGVGNAIVTKYGTCVVPIQVSTSRGTVSAGFIYSNDGVNWTRSQNVIQGLSESSITGWIDSSGRQEIHLWSRRDPNGAGKACNYVYQTGTSVFGQTWSSFAAYNDKIPSRGGSGCQGSAITAFADGQNVAPKFNCLVSFANNYFNNISAYFRDDIVVGGFSLNNLHSNNAPLITYEQLTNINTAVYNGVPYGGYSILAYNHKNRKLGIAYEDSLGIRYRDLSHLIKPFLYEGA